MSTRRLTLIFALTVTFGNSALEAAEVLFSAPPLPTPTPISPITATANSDFTGRTASDTVGGFNFTTGLSAGTGPVDPDTGLVFPQHNTTTTDMWLTNNFEPGEITFDLGAVFKLDRAWIYNYNESGSTGGNPFFNRGADTTGDVFTSTDGVLFTLQPSLSNLPLMKAPGASGYDTPDVIDFGLIDAQYIRFANLSTATGDGNFVGLSEVIFFEGQLPPLTPEPSTFILFGVVIGILGGCWYRSRRAAA